MNKNWVIVISILVIVAFVAMYQTTKNQANVIETQHTIEDPHENEKYNQQELEELKNQIGEKYIAPQNYDPFENVEEAEDIPFDVDIYLDLFYPPSLFVFVENVTQEVYVTKNRCNEIRLEKLTDNGWENYEYDYFKDDFLSLCTNLPIYGHLDRMIPKLTDYSDITLPEDSNEDYFNSYNPPIINEEGTYRAKIRFWYDCDIGEDNEFWMYDGEICSNGFYYTSNEFTVEDNGQTDRIYI